MTVKELITILKKQDPKLEVLFESENWEKNQFQIYDYYTQGDEEIDAFVLTDYQYEGTTNYEEQGEEK